MRIISQDRTSDIPYDRATLYTCKWSGAVYHICASLGFDIKNDFHIGEYESKERCIEILQEIREIAVGKLIAYNYLSEEEYRTLVEESRKLSVQSFVTSNVDMKVIGETYFLMPEE